MESSSVGKMPKKFCLYEYDKELAIAFKGDCEEFLQEYESMQSLGYDDFAKVWQLKRFTYVFAGQNYALLLRDLCENYFYIVKKFIMFPRSIHTQIGAFYLLYGLYYKQPLKNWVKIRLTLDEYKKITELIDTMKARQQYDALYIFAKMKTDQAFLYTALLKPLGPEARFVKSYELYYDDTFTSSKTESALSHFKGVLSESELVSDLEMTNNEYQEQLRRYAAKCPSLAPFSSTIVEDLHAAFFDIVNNQSNEQDVESPGKSVKQQIKDKAMANKNAVYRGLRNVKTAADEDLADSKMNI
ncbi:hypothetical protein NQ318_014998 [Aromia moschata]|uniref:snRNA-activating protein complex subunit 1 n=1 Tax=Aromia moschata TaxID=1265417 RepID=A0AAV8YWS5_9CUCU|nr:hypothetical protein NQ318_014998 [Aromia moschata]